MTDCSLVLVIDHQCAYLRRCILSRIARLVRRHVTGNRERTGITGTNTAGSRRSACDRRARRSEYGVLQTLNAPAPTALAAAAAAVEPGAAVSKVAVTPPVRECTSGSACRVRDECAALKGGIGADARSPIAAIVHTEVKANGHVKFPVTCAEFRSRVMAVNMATASARQGIFGYSLALPFILDYKTHGCTPSVQDRASFITRRSTALEICSNS